MVQFQIDRRVETKASTREMEKVGQKTRAVQKESPRESRKEKVHRKARASSKGQRPVARDQKEREKVSPNNVTHVANPGTLLEIVGSLHKSETWLQTWRKDLRFKDPHHPHTPATQYKVARIVEVSEDVQQHDELIFDMRRCSNAEVFMEA